MTIGTIEVNPTSDLEVVRAQINKFVEESKDLPKISPEWCFVDCKQPFFNLNSSKFILKHIACSSMYRRKILQDRQSPRILTLCDGHSVRFALHLRMRRRYFAANARRRNGSTFTQYQPSNTLHYTGNESKVGNYILVSSIQKCMFHFFNLNSDEGSLDSPSDHPPMSPKNVLSPDECPNTTTNKVNGDNSSTSPDGEIKIRRWL